MRVLATVNFSEEVTVQIYSEQTPAKRRYETVALRDNQLDNNIDGKEMEMLTTAKSSSSAQAARKKTDPVNPLFAGLSGAARSVKTRSRTPEVQATKGRGRVSSSTSAVRTTKGEMTSSNILLELEVPMHANLHIYSNLQCALCVCGEEVFY